YGERDRGGIRQIHRDLLTFRRSDQVVGVGGARLVDHDRSVRIAGGQHRDLADRELLPAGTGGEAHRSLTRDQLDLIRGTGLEVYQAAAILPVALVSPERQSIPPLRIPSRPETHPHLSQ